MTDTPKKEPRPEQRPKSEGGNLVPFTSERAREANAKGAEARKATVRRRKRMAEMLDVLLARPLPPGNAATEMELAEFFDIPLSEVTVQHAVLLAQIRPAMHGDKDAIRFLRDTVGDAPTKELNITGEVPTPLAPVKPED